MKERAESVVRVNEGEDGRSAVAAAAAVFVGPPAVGWRLPRPLLDDGRGPGAPESASSTGEGRNG